MRRTLVALTAALAALVAASGVTAAGPAPRLTEIGGVTFPDRGYVLTLPSPETIDPADVRVKENGSRVSGLRVASPSTPGTYVVRYRSLAGPEERVRVEAQVPGFDAPAVAGYETPPLQVTPAAPYTQPVGERLVQSAWVMVLVSLLTAGLGAFAVFVIIAPRRSTLRSRIGAFVSLAPVVRVEERPPTAPARGEQEEVAPTPTRRKERKSDSRWARWEEELEIAGFEISATSLAIWTVVGTFTAGWLLFLLTGWWLAPPLALTVPLGVRTYVKWRLDRKRRQFADQLPDNLEVLAAALRAGHSLIGALSVVVVDAPEPSQDEFRRVVQDEQLGVPLEDALAVVVARMANRDLEQVALVARLQRETGASSAEVLERVVGNVRDRQDVRRLVRTLTAQGRLSGIVLVGLPIFLLLYMTLFNREYVSPLYTETLGRGMLITASILIVLGWLAIKKIINIKV